METEPKHYSTAEAEQLLKTKFDIPGSIRNFLGHENVRSLANLMADQSIRDLDILYLTGELTKEEAGQYRKVLPEVDDNKRVILEVVNKMLIRFKTALASCRNRKELGEVVLKALNDVVKLTVCLATTEIETYGGLLMSEFKDAWEFAVFEAVEDYVRKNSTPENVDFFKAMCLQADQRAPKKGETSRSEYLKERDRLNRIIDNPFYRSRLESVTDCHPLGDKAAKQLKEALEAESKEIIELAQYRKILFTPFALQEAEIAIMCDDVFENSSNYWPDTCMVELSLNPHEGVRKPQTKGMNTNGNLSFQVTLRDGVFPFFLSRTTGELCFVQNHAKSISCVMSEDQYLALKRTVYGLVLAYLKSKEPDIDDLFKEHKVITTRQQVEAVIEAESPALVEEPEDPVVPTWTYQAWVPTPKAIPDEEISVTRQTHERNAEYIRRLKGLSGNEVLAILKRLLDEPVRIQGSHHIFRSPRNNATFPIPIHSGESVKFPLLLSCLKKWDIPLEEFCNEI